MKYSLRRLTFSRDKLVAIQSIANEMLSTYPDSDVPGSDLGEYIPFAGMWVSNLRTELLWRPWNGIPSYAPEYRAPSWSWAAVDGGIVFPMQQSSHAVRRWYGDEMEVKRFGERMDDGVVGTRNYLKVRAHVQLIGSMVERDRSNLWAVVDNGAFPFSFRTNGNRENNDGGHGGDIFAHGYLDKDNTDSLLDTVGTTADFVYVHICNSLQPTGLILKQNRPLPPKSSSSPSGTRTSNAAESSGVWTRAGVATVFRNLLHERIDKQLVVKAEDMQTMVLI
jgi:hypothetical protein